MKESRRLVRAAVLSVVIILAAVPPAALAACGSEDSASASSTSDKNVAATIKDKVELSTYAAAASAAGLDQTLAGAGPYTVFAANDSTIEAAGATLDESYVKASTIEGTGLTKADATEGTKNDGMLEDNTIVTYEGADGSLYVNSIKASGEPIVCSNGVIYVVDGVITPKE